MFYWWTDTCNLLWLWRSEKKYHSLLAERREWYLSDSIKSDSIKELVMFPLMYYSWRMQYYLYLYHWKLKICVFYLFVFFSPVIIAHGVWPLGIGYGNSNPCIYYPIELNNFQSITKLYLHSCSRLTIYVFGLWPLAILTRKKIQ